MKNRAVLVLLALPLVLGAGCGSDSSSPKDTTTKGSGGHGGSPKPSTKNRDGGLQAQADGGRDATAPGAASDAGPEMSGTGVIDEACQGFSLKDTQYSPGGTTLPNKCKAFDATTNNPYAVRCVDAWPWYKTTFPGDQYCILPPPPDKGIQYGVHPQGKQWFAQVSSGDMSGYEHPSDDFVMEDGEEEQFNYETGVDTDKDQNFYRDSVRMRPGSHHMIIAPDDGSKPQEVWGPPSTDGLFGPSLPGAQRPDENAPKTLAKPDEDKGLYSVLPAKAGITFNMHHFNVTGGQILKEAWTNLWWESDATVQVHGILGLSFTQVRSLNVAPGSIQDLHYSWDITQPIRLLTAFGHRHAWTTNFSSWVEKPDGNLDIVYQSYDWFDEPTYRYDSMTKNPAPAPDKRTDGGSSGIRTLMPGEKLHFNCHIEYTAERAAEVNAPTPAQALHFANQAFSAEMCILFGSTADVMLSSPANDSSPLPDFAAQR